MDKTDQELLDIADRMLQDMEKEYWQVQQQNFSVECPEEDGDAHGGYQLIDDNDVGNGLNSESEDEEDQQQEEQLNKDQEVVQKCEPSSCEEEANPKNESVRPQENVELGELVEVQPYKQWVPEEKQVSIDSQKIKGLSLKMNLPIPDWANDENLFKNRLLELFGKAK